MSIAACYLRVSTESQTTENQQADCERLARARGFEPRVFRETVSAAAASRPELDLVLELARRGELGAVVVWSLDRLHRSMQRTVDTVLELDRLRVPVYSVRESWLDTNGPTRGLLVAIFGWMAEQERAQLIERTKAGLARARARGATLGRPRASPIMCAAAAEKVDQGYPVALAARTYGVSRGALRAFLERRQNEEAGEGGPNGAPLAENPR